MSKNQENKKKDPLEMILNGEAITKTISTKRGKFTIALPLPRDIREIEVEVAGKLNGLPMNSFSIDSISNFRAYSTLDRVITDAPEWWEEMESSEECPDDDLVAELYRGYLQFYRTSQKNISKSRFRGKSEVGKARTKNKNMGDGAFSDITHGSENEGADS